MRYVLPFLLLSFLAACSLPNISPVSDPPNYCCGDDPGPAEAAEAESPA